MNPTSHPPPSPTLNRLAGFLRQRAGAPIQILIVAAGLLLSPLSSIWSPIVMAIIALALIQFLDDDWGGLGFRRPAASPARWITEGTVVGLLWQFVALGILVPVLNGLLHRETAPANHAGDWAYYISYVILVGIAHALAKGLVYRAFLLSRLEQLFGRTPTGTALAFVIASILFGLGNWYQGYVGVIVGVTVGAVFNLLFYWSRRNIWPTLLAHAVYNSAALTLIFLGRL